MRTTGLIWLLAWTPCIALGNAVSEEDIRNLRSSVPTVREHAAKALGRSQDASAVPALIAALEDSEKSVRREAAKALAFIKDPRAVEPLVKTLLDEDMNVRLFAVYALGELKATRAVPQLLEALEDPQWCVRDQAAWTLLEMNDPGILPSLVTALEKDRIDTTLLVRLLRFYGDPDTSRQVAKVLDDPDPAKQLRAIRVLREMSDPESLDSFIGALENSHPKVRHAAVLAIVKLWNDRARKPLEALVDRETDDRVRRAAKDLLYEHSMERNLAAHWSFDDENTETATDVSGRGNDGQIKGCSSTKGKLGLALRFGKGRHIEFGQPAGLPIANQSLTFLAWVKSNTENGVVIARGGAYCGYSLYLKDGVAKFGIHREQEGPGYIAAGKDNVVGKWVHLAGVIRQDRLELYVDGKLAATVETAGAIPGNCGQGMEIGFDAGNSPAEITEPFDGLIDEVKIYNTDLTAEEIAEQVRTVEPPSQENQSKGE